MSETADLFRAGLERLAAGDLGGYLDLCSEDVEFEFPFAPPGRPERVRGREDLRRYLEPLLARATYDEISNLVVYETDVAGTIVAEMAIGLRMLDSGRAYSRRYVAVVRSAGGHVVSYRDYWAPLASSGPASPTEAS
ncbi:MAG: nuclear transport factor 2 family protein [Acidimicrobiales bacterium]